MVYNCNIVKNVEYHIVRDKMSMSQTLNVASKLLMVLPTLLL